MEILQIFKFQDDNEVRTIVRNGEPWFVAKDVCRILGIYDVSTALSRLNEDQKGVSDAHQPNLRSYYNTAIVNELGFYTLVYTSCKPEAKLLQEWLTREVLPALRNADLDNASQQAQPQHPALPPADIRLQNLRDNLVRFGLEEYRFFIFKTTTKCACWF